MAYIAVLGYGTVGSGVVETLETNRDSIDKRSGEQVRLKYVLDLRDFPEDPVQRFIVHDFNIILNDDEVKVVVEVMGGVEPAYSFVKQCLLKGKSVVTSNKELVAKHGAELLSIAKQQKLNFLFEASVGGGIPIIRPLNSSFAADDIYEVSGILNGTTNYILTKMKKEGMNFDDALKLAQDMGFAEKNPDADVLGYDAGRKIAILASLAFGKQVNYEDVFTEGITKISLKDMEYAQKMDSALKLVGTCKKNDKGFYIRVTPLIVSNESPLSNVEGVFNAIVVKGNIIGDVMFYGKGAGKLPTASAVVADVVDCVKHDSTNIVQIWSQESVRPINNDEVLVKCLIRFKNNDYDNLIAKINEQFSDYTLIKLDNDEEEFGIIIDKLREWDLKVKRQLLADDILNVVRID